MQQLTDRVILITGATDGLGKRVAYDLAERGAVILLHGRNCEKGQAVLQEIQNTTDNDELHYYNANFISLNEIRELAEEIKTDCNQIDVLINNAGIGPVSSTVDQREESADGYELRFQVNYLAPFLLTRQLLPLLRQSTPSRIINVASVGQYPLDFDNVMLENEYSSWRAYRQSKLALIMFTFDLADRLEGTDVTANSLHPATMMRTNMVDKYFGGIAGRIFHWATQTILRGTTTTVQEGANAVEFLATSSQLENVTGEYFNGKQQTRANPQAYDEEARRRLRQLSKRLCDKTAINRKFDN